MVDLRFIAVLFFEIRTPVRRVLPAAGASSGAGF